MADIYKEITVDHEHHRALLERLDATEGDSIERRNLFAELRRELTAHANAEEQTFYATLIEDPQTQEKARHSVHEHAEADEMLQKLEETDLSSPGWLATFRKLKEELEHHMDEEEEEVFPKARTVISSAEAERMGPRFRDRKRAEMT